MRNSHPNRGNLHGRTDWDPLERKLAEHWENKCVRRPGINNGHDTIESILLGDRIKKVTARDRYVAASVVQWMGTNCGMSFLEMALRSAGVLVWIIGFPNRNNYVTHYADPMLQSMDMIRAKEEWIAQIEEASKSAAQLSFDLSEPT